MARPIIWTTFAQRKICHCISMNWQGCIIFHRGGSAGRQGVIWVMCKFHWWPFFLLLSRNSYHYVIHSLAIVSSKSRKTAQRTTHATPSGESFWKFQTISNNFNKLKTTKFSDQLYFNLQYQVWYRYRVFPRSSGSGFPFRILYVNFSVKFLIFRSCCIYIYRRVY